MPFKTYPFVSYFFKEIALSVVICMKLDNFLKGFQTVFYTFLFQIKTFQATMQGLFKV